MVCFRGGRSNDLSHGLVLQFLLAGHIGADLLTGLGVFGDQSASIGHYIFLIGSTKVLVHVVLLFLIILTSFYDYNSHNQQI